ncbi:hypothetical protein AMECASPLE_015669 [Ameca splendens]|uniref:Uncharacterized protein n=1 Tax=Ameca splendens TaxID=208324 RepID=A0ABV0XQV4_9TELE
MTYFCDTSWSIDAAFCLSQISGFRKKKNNNRKQHYSLRFYSVRSLQRRTFKRFWEESPLERQKGRKKERDGGGGVRSPKVRFFITAASYYLCAPQSRNKRRLVTSVILSVLLSPHQVLCWFRRKSGETLEYTFVPLRR